MSIERNAPCPCGSGIKYKKCCWLKTPPKPSELDRRLLVGKMIDWAANSFRASMDESWSTLLQAFSPEERKVINESLPDSARGTVVLAADYFCFQFHLEYRQASTTAIQHFLRHSGPLPTAERAFFERLASTHLRAFRVVSVAADSIEVVDILARTGPRIRVFCFAPDFPMQSRVVARLVEVNDRLEFAMVIHLQIFDTKNVQEAYKQYLKSSSEYIALNSIQTGKPIRGRDQTLARQMFQLYMGNPEYLAHVPLHMERVKAAAYSRCLYHLWLDDLLLTITEDISHTLAPTMLVAGTGEPVLLHEDDYDILDYSALLEILRAQADVQISINDTSASRMTLVDGKLPEFSRPRTTINFDSREKLHLFHPSQGLQQAGKSWFDQIAGKTVRYRQTRVTDPRDSLSAASNVVGIGAQISKEKSAGQNELMQNPEVQRAIVATIKRQYATWSTDRIPALGNKTPKELMSTKSGRDRVRALLLSYEQAPSMGFAIDYEFLWQELGLQRRE